MQSNLSHIAKIIIIAALFVPKLMWGQTDCDLSLEVQILDKSNGKTIPFANILINDGEKGASTDSEGNFSITQLCNKSYKVQIMHLSYLKLDTVLTPKKNLRIELAPNSVNLGDVTVQGNKPVNTTQAIQAISNKELNSTRGKALGESLKNLSGLNSISTGATVSKPVIHGLHSHRILILNNGVRLEGQQWSKDASPEIDPFVASKITVLQGANSVRYGADALGGVILVDAPDLRKTIGLEGDINYVRFNNNKQNVVSGSIGGNLIEAFPVSFRLQGTYNRAGNSKTANYYLDNTGAKEKNFSGALGTFQEKYGAEIYYSQYNASIGIYRGSHIHNIRDVIEVFKGNVVDTVGFDYEIDRPRQDVAHELFKASSFYKPNDRNKINLIFSRQFNKRQEYDVFHGGIELDEAAAPQLSYKLTTHILDLDWNHKHTENISSLLGASYIEKKNTNTSAFYLPKGTSSTYGAFWIPRWKKDNLSLESGLRYDVELRKIKPRSSKDSVKENITYKSLSANVGGSYTFLQNFSAKLNFGLAWRPPSIVELYTSGLSHGDASFQTGDPNMRPEKLYSSILSLEYSKKNFFDFGISVFRKFFDGYIYQEPTGKVEITIRGVFPAFRYAQANARMDGFNYHVDFTYIKNLRITHRGSILRAINQETGRYLSLIPPDQFDYIARYTLPKIKSFNNLYGEIRYHHHNRQTRYDPELELKETPPPAPYDLVDIEAGLTIMAGNQPIILGISINNAFNELYRSYMNRFRYYADDIGRNVSLRIRVPFEVSFKKDENFVE